ncbi:MAG: AsmA-like C-terminal region-containing protein, partial [Saprospiraceae bacterium]
HYATGKIEVQLDSVLTLKHVIQPLIVDVELLDDDDFSNQYQLKVNRFNMGLGENNFVKGTAHIRNSDAPFLNADIEANMSLKKLGELLPSAYMELRDGDFNMDLTYAAPLRDTMNAENYFFNANIDGYAEMNQGYLFYNYRDFKIENINGKFRFDNRALYIDNIDLNLNDNQLIAKGESKDFFPFFLKPNRRANIVMNVNSPSFDFGNFTAPHGLGKDSIDLQESIVRAEPDTTINVFVKTGSYIDLLLAKGSIDMTTTVNELRYNKFLAEDFFGNISIHPDSVQLKKVNMEIANGVCSMNGSITNIVLHEPKMQLSADMEGHDLKELFHQLGFYDQMPLSSENVEGLGFASLTINADVNSNYAILPETMQGDVVVKLSGGELMDVDAFDRVPRFLAKKRNLDHILMDTILVNGQIIGSNLYIDEFDVHSSAFGFSVTGVYNFANAAETKILYAVPFSNLYKRYFTLAQLNGDKVKRKGMKLNLERHNKKGKKKTRWRLRGKGSYKEVD